MVNTNNLSNDQQKRSYLENVLATTLATQNINPQNFLGAIAGNLIKDQFMNGVGIGEQLTNGLQLKKDQNAQSVVDSLNGSTAPAQLTTPQYQSSVNPTDFLGVTGNRASDIAANMAQQGTENIQQAVAANGALQQRMQNDMAGAQAQAQQAATAEQAQKKQLLGLGLSLATGDDGGAGIAGVDNSLATGDAGGAGIAGVDNSFALPNNLFDTTSFYAGATRSNNNAPVAPASNSAPQSLTHTQRQGMSAIAALKEAYGGLQDMLSKETDPAKQAYIQGQMAGVNNQAQTIRDSYKNNGIELPMAGSDSTLKQLSQRIVDDNTLNIDRLTNGKDFLSSDQYYYKLLNALKKKGMSKSDAENYARQYTAEYQADLIARERSALRDFGIDNNALNDYGVELVARMLSENPQVANVYGSLYANPKDIFGLDSRRALADDALRNNMQLLGAKTAASEQLNNQKAQQAFALAQWKAANQPQRVSGSTSAKKSSDNSSGKENGPMKFSEAKGVIKDYDKWNEDHPDEEWNNPYANSVSDAQLVIDGMYKQDPNTEQGGYSWATELMEFNLKGLGGTLDEDGLKKRISALLQNNPYRDSIMSNLDFERYVPNS